MSRGDREKINAGEESELERTMKRMKDSCCMAWLVLSTSSLLDNAFSVDKYGEVPQDKLESLVRKSGCKPVTLQNIMRNSSNISTATTRDNVNRYFTVNIPKSIREAFI